MSGDVTVKRDFQDPEAILALLQSAYRDWGSDAEFHWKYTQDPSFNPEQAVRLELDGEIAAFRRIYRRSLRTDDGRGYRVAVLGDTCVAPAFRGQGLYSRLHRETTRLDENSDRDLTCTFNRVGHVTHAANRERGWRQRQLSLHVRVLDPTRAIPPLARAALNDHGRIGNAFRTAGAHIGLRLGDTTVSLGRLADEQFEDIDPAIALPVPRRLLPAMLEVAGSVSHTAALRRRITRLPESNSGPESSHDVTLQMPPVDSATIDGLLELYEATKGKTDLWFQRKRAVVKHMVAHPGLVGVILAKRAGRLDAAGIVAESTRRGVPTVRVLDVVARSDSAFSALTRRLTAVAKDRNAAMIVLLSSRETNPRWLRLDRQVMMWTSHGVDDTLVRTGRLHLGFYDVR